MHVCTRSQNITELTASEPPWAGSVSHPPGGRLACPLISRCWLASSSEPKCKWAGKIRRREAKRNAWLLSWKEEVLDAFRMSFGRPMEMKTSARVSWPAKTWLIRTGIATNSRIHQIRLYRSNVSTFGSVSNKRELLRFVYTSGTKNVIGTELHTDSFVHTHTSAQNSCLLPAFQGTSKWVCDRDLDGTSR